MMILILTTFISLHGKLNSFIMIKLFPWMLSYASLKSNKICISFWNSHVLKYLSKNYYDKLEHIHFNILIILIIKQWCTK